jgi:cytochrome c553
MRTLSFPDCLRIAATILAAALATACAARHAAATAAPATPVTTSAPASPPPSPGAAASSLIEQGAARFKANKCDECHGAHGEGTDDAPDLISLRMNAEEIAAFLQKPSAHARSVGMPTIPVDSPELQPLVAFVLSLERPR